MHDAGFARSDVFPSGPLAVTCQSAVRRPPFENAHHARRRRQHAQSAAARQRRRSACAEGHVVQGPGHVRIGLSLMIVSEAATLARIEPFWSWNTPICWTGFILFADAIVWRARG